MKNKFLLLITVAIAISTVGCNKNENSESSSQAETSGAIATSQAESKSENIEYNSTFNEEVFNQIIQNIKIGDKTISFPCTLEDFGEGFEYSEDTMYSEEWGITAVDLLYNNSIIAFVSLRAKDDDKVLKDNELTGILFSDSIYEKQNVINNISVGGITFQDTKEKVQEKFGDPSDKNKRSSGFESFYYKTSEKKYPFRFWC